jgi:hypothetical protein
MIILELYQLQHFIITAWEYNGAFLAQKCFNDSGFIIIPEGNNFRAWVGSG